MNPKFPESDLPPGSTQIYSKLQINDALDTLANKLNQELKNENPVVLCVMQGGLLFSGHLIPKLTCMLEIDYIHVSRYHNKTSGAELIWKAYPVTSLEDRSVLILDDILDEGKTLQAIIKYCEQQGAQKIESAVLLRKNHSRCVDHDSDEGVLTEKTVKLAIIGGSLLKGLSDLSNISGESINTPFGTPSGHFVTGMVDDIEVTYINRHGSEHHIAPHQINYKANMFVLKMLEVTDIIAVTAVGGITDAMSPMKWVVPDQIIDYTHGRAQTFNDVNDTEVNHIDFSYPFDETIRNRLMTVLEEQGCEHETQGTYGVTQGPRLETIAEIKRMQQDGCDIVGMTAMPEASLARELEMKYATLSLVVNWAAGKSDGGVVSMDEISELIADGNAVCEKIINEVISRS